MTCMGKLFAWLIFWFQNNCFLVGVDHVGLLVSVSFCSEIAVLLLMSRTLVSQNFIFFAGSCVLHNCNGHAASC